MTRRTCGRLLAVALAALALPLFADSFSDAESRGVALMNAGKYQEAEQAFIEAAKSPEAGTALAARVNAGYCRGAQGDLEGAIAWYEGALAIDKDNLNALEGLAGTCFGDKKNYEKGHEYASRAEALYSANPAVYYNLACYYGYKGDAARALKYADLALFYGFSDVELLSKDADFTPVRSKEPFKSLSANVDSIQSALSLYTKADDLLKKGNNEDFLRSCQQAVAACRAALGKDSLAEASILSWTHQGYFNLKKYSPDLDAQSRSLAILLAKLGSAHPRTADQYILVGNCRYLLGQYDECLKCYLAALSIRSAALGEDSSETRAAYGAVGGIYSAKGEPAKAAEYLRKAIPTADSGSAEEAAAKAAAEARLGNALTMSSQYSQAESVYSAALKIQLDALGPEHPDVAQTYAALGNLRLYLGKFDEAERNYAQAYAIQAKALGVSDAATVASSEALGDVYTARSEFKKAMDRYSADLETITKAFGADSVQAASCYERLGGAEYSLGDYGGSRAHYERAMTIWAKAMGAGYPEVANCLMGMAASSYTEGLFSSSADEYSRALPILLKAYGEANISVAKGYLGMGLSYYSMGEYPKAISYYEKAIDIQRKLAGDANPDLSRSYMNLSVAYAAIPDLYNAIMSINKCLEIQNKILGSGHLDVSVSLKIQGGFHASLGNYDDAALCYRKALEIEEGILGHDHQQVAETLNNLGTVYQDQGQYDKAIEAYRESLAIKLKVFGESSMLLARDYLNIGTAYWKKGDAEKGLAQMSLARDIARRSPDRQLAIQIAHNMGLLLIELKRYGEAKKAFEEGVARIEEARRSVGATKAEFMERNLSIYYRSFEVSSRLGDMDGAFKTAESLKARGYLDRLSLGKALGAFGIPAKDKNRMIELGDTIAKLANVQLTELAKPVEAQDKKTLVSLAGRVESLQAEFDRLDRSLMSNPRYRDLREPSIAKLKDAQRSLGEDEACLDYVLWGEGSAWYARCVVIKRDSAEIVDLDESFDYNSGVGDLREAIKTRAKDRDAKAGRLYGALLKPLEAKLAGISKLIIVPDDMIALAPFDALRKDGNSPYLGQRYQISLAPSVSVLLTTAGRKYGPRKGEWLGLGGVNYGAGTAAEGRGLAVSAAASETTKAYYAAQGPAAYFDALGLEWAALPGTEREVKAIASEAYGGKKATLLLGDQASAANVRRLSDSGELAQQKIVHFACHAFFDGDYPQYSALVLSEAAGRKEGDAGETGYLTVDDVSLLRFNADLVVLSACDTGKGGFFFGDGMIGFTRSLLVAGANRAEVTLWPVDDAATQRFMVRWYALMKEKGLDYSAALAQVKREFMKSDTYSDPAYWSGFVLYGR